ncbi:ATP-dependent DNA helicase Rep, partial [Linderina pennispora]
MSQPASLARSDSVGGRVESEGKHKKFTLDEYEVLFANDITIQELLAPIDLPSQQQSQPTIRVLPAEVGEIGGVAILPSGSDTADGKPGVEDTDTAPADAKPYDNPAERIQLDERQEFVSKLDIDKPLLIMAGAGSGKTSTLCARVIEMIKRGVSPTRIMVITFTNKAAGELRERILKYMKISGMGDTALPYASTFHSWCYQLVAKHFDALGLARRPNAIAGEAELKVVVRLAHGLIDDCRMLTQSEIMLNVPPPSDDPDAKNTMFVTDRFRRWDTAKALATERLGWRESPQEPAHQDGTARKRRKRLDDTDTKSEYAIHEDLYLFLYGQFGKGCNLANVVETPSLQLPDSSGKSGAPTDDKSIVAKLYLIQSTKSRGYSPKDYDIETRSLIEAYNEILHMSNLIDFDDMLTMANRVLKNPPILQAVRSMYPYLLVD